MSPALHQDLCSLIAQTEGLRHCQAQIASLTTSEAACEGNAVLELLTAIDCMTFADQVAFVEAFYARQEPMLTAKLANSWIPAVPLVHEGVVCDGCGTGPMNTLRFKCQTCPDYDLCGECFPRKDSVNPGRCSGHKFELIEIFPESAKGAWWKGKGLGKGLGKCRWWASKGKGKGRGCEEATWEQAVPAPQQEAKLSDELAAQPQAQFDMSFPVVVEDGRRLTISWNRPDDPQQVAESFAQQHGIMAVELDTIVAFVRQANAMMGGIGDEAPAAASAGVEPEREPTQVSVASCSAGSARIAEAMPFQVQQQQLTDLGICLPPDVLCQLLQQHGGDVQRVVESLL